MKVLLKNRGQITMEFAILMAAVVAVAAILGFYYLKTVESSSTKAQNENIVSNTVKLNKVVDIVNKVKEAIING
ncbi:class III signal peptide domain-containing protein, archaeosortase D/PIP-CTERM system-associated [Methanocaldococcus indicus]|uniref:class III signal peptide domain-containing protein, archaeosortase D/PIP-CTERM system-associated n=1 Tax=Methanocaldococcus indicus TaxID=213231 RepID=UPI003C6D75B1